MKGLVISAAVFFGCIGLGITAVGAFYLTRGQTGVAVVEFCLAAVDFACCALNVSNFIRMGRS